VRAKLTSTEVYANVPFHCIKYTIKYSIVSINISNKFRRNDMGRFYCLKSRRMKWAGHVARWVDNIKMDLKRDRMGWYGLD
jgi:hypothetical protein